MRESRRILEAWRRLAAQDRPAALCTVVETQGPAFRKAGTRALFSDTGLEAGALSGGCLEADVLAHARQAMAERRSRLLRYGPEADGLMGIDLGCGGTQRLLLEPIFKIPGLVGNSEKSGNSGITENSPTVQIPPASESFPPERLPAALGPVWLAEATARGDWSTSAAATCVSAGSEGVRFLLCPGRPLWIQGHVSGRLAALLSDRLRQLMRVTEADERFRREIHFHSESGLEFLLETFAPAPRLCLFGAGGASPALARLACGLGWRVAVADWRAPLLAKPDFPVVETLLCAPEGELVARLAPSPGAACVVMTHRFETDLAILRDLLPRPLTYLGLIGSQSRWNRALESLGPTLASLAQERICCPAGMDLGGETPEEIALSIAAELQFRFKKNPGTLRGQGVGQGLGQGLDQRSGQRLKPDSSADSIMP